MAQNIPNITVVNKADAPHEYEIKVQNNGENQESSAQSGVLEQSDENTYQDTNFEDMSLEEVTDAALSLEQEIMALKAEIDNLQTIIESNTEIKEMYQSQYEEYKNQMEELQKELNEAETPQEKQSLNSRISSLRGEISSLNSQIIQMIGIIQAHNEMKSDATGQYISTNADYMKAQLAQNSKEAELNRSQSAAQTSSSPSTSATSGTFGAAPKGSSSGKASDNLINFLKEKEGCRLSAYQDSGGVWTIGYGHTSGVSAGQTISQAQAEQYLRQDLSSFENEVSSYAQSVGVKLTQGQFDALVSFTYNCGGGNLRKSGIMEMLKSGNISGAQNKMKQYIHDASGNALQGLVTRRETEASWLAA